MQLADELALSFKVLAKGKQTVFYQQGFEIGDNFARGDSLFVFEFEAFELLVDDLVDLRGLK